MRYVVDLFPFLQVIDYAKMFEEQSMLTAPSAFGGEKKK